MDGPSPLEVMDKRFFIGGAIVGALAGGFMGWRHVKLSKGSKPLTFKDTLAIATSGTIAAIASGILGVAAHRMGRDVVEDINYKLATRRR